MERIDQMTRRILLAIVACTLLAGCSATPPEPRSHGDLPALPPAPDATPPTQQVTATTTTSTSPSGRPPPNRAPAASIDAVVNATRVRFTLHGSDPDGDAVRFTFTVSGASPNTTSGSGDDLPLSLTMEFPPGTSYLAVLRLDDGTTATEVRQAGNISATSSVLQHVSGSYVTGSASECANNAGLDGATVVTFDPLPATYGRGYVATYTTAAPVAYTVVSFFDGMGMPVGGTPEDIGGVLYTPAPGKTEDRGLVGDGAVFGFLSSCGGLAVDVDYVVN